MRKIVFILLIFLSATLFSQDTTNTNQENAFDFWVGNWSLEWTRKDGKTIKGKNIVTKILDTKVVKENFEDPSTGFKGTSISVYSPIKGTWH